MLDAILYAYVLALLAAFVWRNLLSAEASRLNWTIVIGWATLSFRALLRVDSCEFALCALSALTFRESPFGIGKRRAGFRAGTFQI